MRINKHIAAFAAAASCLLMAHSALAQVPQYGTNVTLEQALKAVAAALAEARNIKVPMAVTVVDNAGQLVAFERMDNTQTGSIAVSQDKAVSAAMFRRPTKAFQDAVAGGGAGLRILTLRGANAVEGGLPITVDGKIIGGIGVSGGSAEQDGGCAKAGADALAAK
jgi:glc operon protein GlcG